MSMGMPVTEEERDGEGTRRNPSESNFASNMYFYGRELCFILALVFTSYAALQNAPPKVAKSPLPVPFFTCTSLVADFYHGQLSPAFERVSESDISFVMYYAPWDSESQMMKSKFKIIAQHYYKEVLRGGDLRNWKLHFTDFKIVYFAAINCWQPLSECRQQFAKIQHFPVLIAYTQLTKGIQYKGIKEAAHMMRFLQFILRPLGRVERPSDLINLMTVHDAVVLGFFDFTGNIGGPGFHTFYSTALKFLERDPHREIGFAVVTNKYAAAEFGVFHTPTVRLYLWNETLEYSQDDEFLGDILTKWISQNIHQVSVWVSPPGVKSLTLSPYVEDGSVLILFTPRNPLLKSVYHYDLLREVGLEYYNCDNNPWVNDLIFSLYRSRIENNRLQRELESECHFWKEKLKYSASPQVQTTRVPGNNESICQGAKLQKVLESSCESITNDDQWKVAPVSSDYCELSYTTNIQHTYFGLGAYSEMMYSKNICCKPEDGVSHKKDYQPTKEEFHVKTSMLTGSGDDRSPQSLIAASEREKCRKLQYAQMVHSPLSKSSGYRHKTPRGFHGLACQTNKTLSLIAMDSLQFHQFAEGLGVHVLNHTDKAAAVIFNAAHETAYILEREVNKDTLLEFIMNYTEGTLNRSLRSKPRASEHHHYPEYDLGNCKQNASSACIQELTSDDFLHVVMELQQNVVVLHHSPFCAFCHSISHFLLTVARYFRTVTNLIFARIDGENNDLPWELTMHHYPTILFFPAHRKSESHAFPNQLPITVPNLVNFVLANLEPGLGQLEGMISLCSSWENSQDDSSAKDCIDRVCSENLEVISDTLSQYRTANFRLQFISNTGELTKIRHILHRQRKIFLLKLQLLKEIHLVLGSIHRLKEGSSEYEKIKRSFEIYHRSVVTAHSDILVDSRLPVATKEDYFIQNKL